MFDESDVNQNCFKIFESQSADRSSKQSNRLLFRFDKNITTESEVIILVSHCQPAQLLYLLHSFLLVKELQIPGWLFHQMLESLPIPF